jgi:hypothetical protein
LRSLQELSRLDQVLERLPRFEAALASGEVTPARVLAVAAIAAPENEEFWLAQARHRTHRELAQRVRIARETLAPAREDAKDEGREGAVTGAAGKPGAAEQAPSEASAQSRPFPAAEDTARDEAILLERKPARSHRLWEAFVEACSRQAGRNVSSGEALEILMAEFWPLVPPGESARGEPAQAESTPEPSVRRAETPAEGGEWVNPLIPSLDEPASRTTKISAPMATIRDYLDAIEAMRIVYGDNKPAWWCQEVMMLHVRLDWARHEPFCRRHAKNYDILERDGFRCTTPGCTSRAGLHGHHVDYSPDGRVDDPWNITCMCSACHLVGLHRKGFIRVRGRAPHRLLWDLGRVRDAQGRWAPKRRYAGEFRIGVR